MLQHKMLALRDGRAEKPELRRTLFFAEAGAAAKGAQPPRAGR